MDLLWVGRRRRQRCIRDSIEGDVAVADGVITHVGGRCASSGLEEYDAAGAVVAPGFIDPHTHLDANLFWDPDLTPSSSFGVTTIVAANCGYALGPLGDKASQDYVVRAMSTVEQIPEEAIVDSVPFNWNSLTSYFAALDALPVLLNHDHLVGHVPMLAAILGVPAVHEPQATPSEISSLAAIFRDAFHTGAVGCLNAPRGGHH